MKKILKMIESSKTEHENIIEAIVKVIARNKYLKDCLKKLDNFEYDYLTYNQEDGVDWQIKFDVTKLRLGEVPLDYIKEALDMHLDGTGVYANLKDHYPYLYQSSCDEIFIHTHTKQVYTGDHNFIPYHDDFHAWLVIEEHMESHGEFPGVFTTDYYGNIDEKKWREDYTPFFPSEGDEKVKLLQDYIDLYDTMKGVNDGGRYDISNFPERFYELLPQELKDLQFNDGVSLYKIEEVTPTRLTFQVEMGDKQLNTPAKLVNAKYGIYEIELVLMSNALRFILEDSEESGDNHGFKMPILPVNKFSVC